MKHYIFKNEIKTLHIYTKNIAKALYMLRKISDANSYSLQSVRLEKHKEGVYSA